jgi:hypothetical protein
MMVMEGVVLEVCCKTAGKVGRRLDGGARTTGIHVANRIYGAGDVVGKLPHLPIRSRMRTAPVSHL